MTTKPDAATRKSLSVRFKAALPSSKNYQSWMIAFFGLSAIISLIAAPGNSLDIPTLNLALQDSFAVQFLSLSYLLAILTAVATFGFRGTIFTALSFILVSTPRTLRWQETDFGQMYLARLGVLTVVSILAAVLVSREQKSRLVTSELNRRLEEVIQEKNRLFKVASEAQENERRRISRDLHDDSLQLLATAMHQLDGAIESGELGELLEAREQVVRAKEILNQTSQAIRRYCEELRPMLLDSMGLVPSVEWMAEELRNNANIRVDFEILGEVRPLRDDDAIHVYRVMQEAFNNIARHSKATAARVLWNYTEEAFRITITDNGVGHLSAESSSGRTLGIKGMYERMELLGGNLTIQSQPGFGTKIALLVPFE